MGKTYLSYNTNIVRGKIMNRKKKKSHSSNRNFNKGKDESNFERFNFEDQCIKFDNLKIIFSKYCPVRNIKNFEDVFNIWGNKTDIIINC